MLASSSSSPTTEYICHSLPSKPRTTHQHGSQKPQNEFLHHSLPAKPRTKARPNSQPHRQTVLIKRKLESDSGVPASEYQLLKLREGKITNTMVLPHPNHRCRFLIAVEPTLNKILFMYKLHSFDEVIFEELRTLNSTVSCLYQLASFRQEINSNKSKNDGGGGIMKCIGFRGGSDKGKTAGVYAYRNGMTSKDFERDQQLYRQLNEYEKHISGSIKRFSAVALKANSELSKNHGLPSFSSPEWVIDDSEVFATNVSITYNNFFNSPHMDSDLNPYTYGIFSYFNPSTLSTVPPRLVNQGHGFLFPDFNTMIDFSAFNGIIEMVWASNSVRHQTLPPPPTLLSTPSFTHFGSSFQINRALANRAKKIKKLSSKDIDSVVFGTKERIQKCMK